MNKNNYNIPYAVLKKMPLNIQMFAFVSTYWTYWKTSGTNNPSLTDYRFYFDVYYSQDLANNYSSIQTNSAEQTNHEQSGEYNITTTCFTAIVDGVNATSGYRTCYQPAYVGRQEFNLGTVYHTVYHNSDGSKSIIWNGRGRRYASNSGYDMYTGNRTITLPTIPRYANITGFNTSNITMSSFNYSVSADASIDYIQHSLNGGAWTDGGSQVITGLTPGTTYTLKCRVRRTDSQLWTESSTINVTTTDVAKISNASVDFDIDNGIVINFTNPSGKQVDLYLESPNGTNRVIRTNITSPYTLSLSESDKNVLFNLSPTSNTLNFRFRLKTDVNASYISYKEGIATISNANPTFTNFTYEDINPITLALTGNPLSIIKGYSNVRTIISSANKMIPQKGANGKEYQLVIGAKQDKVTYSDIDDVYIDINAIDNNVFTMYAKDSRNNSTPKIISPETYIDYFKVAKGSADYNYVNRANETDEETTLNLKGIFCNINFGAIQNDLIAKYKFKKAEDTVWGDYIDITLTKNGNDWSFNGLIAGDKGALGFTIADNFNIQVLIEDKLSSITIDIPLDCGEPTMALGKNGVSIKGLFDESKGPGLQVNGNIYEKINGEFKKVLFTSIIKTVTGLSISKGMTITDNDISKANAIIVYYCNVGNPYTKSFCIPRGMSDWFIDTYPMTIYISVPWSSNTITVSQYSQDDASVKVVGYTLIY